jgi:dTDP-glucose pyrophosphorylase
MDWKKAKIRDDQTIREALQTIDAGGLQIGLIVNDRQQLQGVVTDGDIRRGILQGLGLDAPVTEVMNTSPKTATLQEDRDSLLARMKARKIQQLPVVDGAGRVVGLEVLSQLLEPEAKDNAVVIMAGGLGTRLRPLTNDTPKPLLKIGDQPILETIIQGFAAHGFHRFYLCVNYKARMIEDYFGEGVDWGIEITYLHERKRLGTAGPLSLLPERPSQPFFVMNGDLLTKLNFTHLLDFHREHDATATMCVREYDMQVPYGVVQTEQHRMTGLEEKPVHHFFVNAGIYVLEPETLDYVPDDAFYDMPDLFEAVIADAKEATVFPVREYWQDIGRMEQFERANGEYNKIFDL